MPEMLDDIAYLSQEIGPRPAGTEEEQQAALYIAEQLQKRTGFTANIEDFSCASGSSVIEPICFGLPALAALVAMFQPLFSIPALLVSLVCAILFVLEIIDRPVLSRAMERGVSQNVVATYTPGISSSPRTRKIVVVANYDSGKVRRELSGAVGGMWPTVRKASVLALVGLAVLWLIRCLFFMNTPGLAMSILNVLNIVGIVLTTIPVVTYIMGRTAAYNEAANNNAAGVAVMMGVAERISNGMLSEEEIVTRSKAQAHGEEEARAAGLVPEGATIEYAVVPQPKENGLASAKAAVAALTGKPLREQAVVPDDDDVVYRNGRSTAPVTYESAGTSSESFTGAGESVSVLENDSTDDVSWPESMQWGSETDSAYGDAETSSAQIDMKHATGSSGIETSEQENLGYARYEGPQEEYTGSSGHEVSRVSLEHSRGFVPEWYRKAQEKARKTDDVSAHPPRRSRFADALDAAEAMSKEHATQAQTPLVADAVQSTSQEQRETADGHYAYTPEQGERIVVSEHDAEISVQVAPAGEEYREEAIQESFELKSSAQQPQMESGAGEQADEQADGRVEEQAEERIEEQTEDRVDKQAEDKEEEAEPAREDEEEFVPWFKRIPGYTEEEESEEDDFDEELFDYDEGSMQQTATFGAERESEEREEYGESIESEEFEEYEEYEEDKNREDGFVSNMDRPGQGLGGWAQKIGGWGAGLTERLSQWRAQHAEERENQDTWDDSVSDDYDDEYDDEGQWETESEWGEPRESDTTDQTFYQAEDFEVVDQHEQEVNEYEEETYKEGAYRAEEYEEIEEHKEAEEYVEVEEYVEYKEGEEVTYEFDAYEESANGQGTNEFEQDNYGGTVQGYQGYRGYGYEEPADRGQVESRLDEYEYWDADKDELDHGNWADEESQIGRFANKLMQKWNHFKEGASGRREEAGQRTGSFFASREDEEWDDTNEGPQSFEEAYGYEEGIGWDEEEPSQYEVLGADSPYLSDEGSLVTEGSASEEFGEEGETSFEEAEDYKVIEGSKQEELRTSAWTPSNMEGTEEYVYEDALEGVSDERLEEDDNELSETWEEAWRADGFGTGEQKSLWSSIKDFASRIIPEKDEQDAFHGEDDEDEGETDWDASRQDDENGSGEIRGYIPQSGFVSDEAYEPAPATLGEEEIQFETEREDESALAVGDETEVALEGRPGVVSEFEHESEPELELEPTADDRFDSGLPLANTHEDTGVESVMVQNGAPEMTTSMPPIDVTALREAAREARAGQDAAEISSESGLAPEPESPADMDSSLFEQAPEWQAYPKAGSANEAESIASYEEELEEAQSERGNHRKPTPARSSIADISAIQSEMRQQPAPLADDGSDLHRKNRLESGRIPRIVLDDNDSAQAAPVAENRRAALRNSLPSLSGAFPAAEDSNLTVSKTGSFAPMGATGAFSPIGDELIANMDPNDIYIEDADDSSFGETTTETGAFTGSGLVEMPESRTRRFFGRFRRQEEQESAQSAAEWLDVDDDFNPTEVGRERGGWESFQENSSYQKRVRGNHSKLSQDEDDTWEGGAYSTSRVRGKADSSRIAQEIRMVYSFRNPDVNTEVWFVALGSEQASNGGTRAFLREHAQELNGAIVINLESLGAGTISYASKEGFMQLKKPSSRLRRYLRKAMDATGIQVANTSLDWRESVASIALRHGMQGMTLVGMDGVIPAGMNQGDDVVENIDPEQLDNMVDFVMEIIKSV